MTCVQAAQFLRLLSSGHASLPPDLPSPSLLLASMIHAFFELVLSNHLYPNLEDFLCF